MITYESCFDITGCAADQTYAVTDGSRSQCSPTLSDPLWDSIRVEALNESARESLLRPLLLRAVLNRSTLAEGLATLLADRLHNQEVELAKLIDEFTETLGNNRSNLEAAREDLSAIQANDPAASSLLQPLLNYKGFLAIQAHRIANTMWNVGRHSLAYYIQRRVSEVFGIDIHPAATIGSGVFIDHVTGVVIGETATVGDDVTILHGVTLGGTGKEHGDRHPKVGPGVYIGANAQLLGNITIGEGSRIGASSVVLKNVPAFSTVAGVPAQIVRHDRRADSSPRKGAKRIA